MILRYDFDKKIDLAMFKKQAPQYTRIFDDIQYEFYLLRYKAIFNIKKCQNTKKYMTYISIYDLKRDSDCEISSSKIIIPLKDIRFKDLGNIPNFFAHLDSSEGLAIYENTNEVTDSICNFIQNINRLEKLNVFC